MNRPRLEIIAFTALRIAAGIMFACGGMQKLFGVLAKHPGPEMWSQLWFGGVIELVCGTLIALGLFTRPAAFLASGTMAVAYIQFHWKGAFDANLLPMANGGGPALTYCLLFFWIWVRGAGPISLDRQLGRSAEI